MNLARIDDIVKIRPWGTVVIEKSILCDGKNYFGLDDGKNIACYTHIHDDHICGLENALGGNNARVYSTDITKRLASALLMNDVEWIKDRTNYRGMNNNEIEKINNLEISFIKANHILGSAQLLVRSSKNNILYSSDFIREGTGIVKDVDYLILDATHGSHSESQYFINEYASKTLVVDKAREILEDSTKQVVIYASRGTMQLAMSWLRSALDENIPFLANKKEANVARVYGEYGYECGNIENSEKFEYYCESKQRCVLFHHGILKDPTDTISSIRIGSSTATSLDNNNTSVINLKEHATIAEICDYVNDISPGYIIVDNSKRTSNPENAPYLMNKLVDMGFEVSLSPERHPNFPID